MDVFETVNNTQVLVATNWTGMKVGSLEQEVTLGAWGLLPDSDYIISIRAKNEKVGKYMVPQKTIQGPFKYYVIKEVGGWAGQMMMFDDKVGGWEWLNDDVIKKYTSEKKLFKRLIFFSGKMNQNYQVACGFFFQ